MKYTVISSVLSSKEKIDQALKNNKIKECERTKYLSLRSTTGYKKMQGLHLNDIQKCEVTFERIIDTNAMSIATHEGVTGIVRDLMKKKVSGGATLFTGVEQGSRKYSSDELLLVRSIQMCKAQILIN